MNSIVPLHSITARLTCKNYLQITYNQLLKTAHSVSRIC